VQKDRGVVENGRADAWSMRPEPSLRGYQVEWESPGGLLLSRRNEVFRADAAGGHIQALGFFPASPWRAYASRLRPIQRALRFLVYNVLELPDGRLFVSFDKSIGIGGRGGFDRIDGLVRPCRILRSGCALGPDGNVYFGEYLQNRQRDQEVMIYRYSPGKGRLEVVRRLSPGAVRHIHGIHRDPYTDELWCVSGDLAAECRILRSRDCFERVETMGEGDESWRCVSIVFTRRAVYYATDSEFERNRIFRLDRASGERRELSEIDGPVYVGKAIGEDVFFAVTAELCPSQIGRSATLWHVDAEDRVSRFASFEKDALHVDYFMVGTLHMARGPGLADVFYVHGVALSGADNRTFSVRRENRGR
jgi:hypothetical protein